MTREVDLSAFLYVALDGHPIGLVGEMKHLLITRHSGASQFVVHAEDILPFCDFPVGDFFQLCRLLKQFYGQEYADKEYTITKITPEEKTISIDVTESGRDMKPLISGMFEAIDRYKALQASTPGHENALVQILREAEETLANA